MASVTYTRNAVTFPPRWSLFIYLHLHAFELLGWWELGQSNGSSLRRVDSILRLLGLLTLQHRLLQFSPQRHHVPFLQGPTAKY